MADIQSLSQNDHDVLIELRTEMRGLRDDFKEAANNTTSAISALQVGKLAKDDFNNFLIRYEKTNDDKEKRLRFTEKWIYYGFGAMGILQLIVIAYQIFKSINP